MVTLLVTVIGNRNLFDRFEFLISGPDYSTDGM
jgi:hypothetical protein